MITAFEWPIVFTGFFCREECTAALPAID